MKDGSWKQRCDNAAADWFDSPLGARVLREESCAGAARARRRVRL